SPKLQHGGDSESRRIVPQALAALRATDRAWLKVVVADVDTDLAQVTWLVAATSWPRNRVFLMPQCRSEEELRAATPELVNSCIDHGYAFTGRLHLQVWSGKRGH